MLDLFLNAFNWVEYLNNWVEYLNKSEILITDRGTQMSENFI